MIKAQRTAQLRAASLHLGVFFVTPLLRILHGLQREAQPLEGGTSADLFGVLQSLKISLESSQVKGPRAEKQSFPPKKRQQRPMLPALLLQRKA